MPYRLLAVSLALIATFTLACSSSARPPRATAPAGQDAAEQRVLDVLAALKQGPGYANVSLDDGRLLRQLTAFGRARKVVELGTSSGYSALWFALALRQTGGHLYTHEIAPEMAAMARRNFDKAGVGGLVTVVEGDAHQTVLQHVGPDEPPIDLVFLDADKQGDVDYLHKLLPQVRPGGLVVAHNMVYPKPDPRFIEAITTDPALETTFVLMDGAGMAVTLKKR